MGTGTSRPPFLPTFLDRVRSQSPFFSSCGECAFDGPDGTISRGCRSAYWSERPFLKASARRRRTIPLETPVSSIGLKFRRIQQIVKSVTTGRMLADGKSRTRKPVEAE